MNKVIIFLLLLFPLTSAGETYYYKLTKKIDGENQYTNTAGGQFITFENKKCYDSDMYGISVGNGFLYYKEHLSSKSPAFEGNSYFGNVIYRFSQDYMVLNIHVNNQIIYVYKRSSIPAGVTTCSLIKNRTSPAKTTYPTIQSVGTYNNQTTKPADPNRPTDNQNKQRFKCAYCKNGRITHNDNAPANFGTSRPKQRCNECGIWYDPNVFVHYHIQCRHCGGTGYTK